MFKEEEPLPCPSAMVMGGLGGVTLHPLGPGEGGGTPRPRGDHGGGDGGEGVESGGHQAGVTLPPYPSEYHPSYLSTMGYQDERPESHSYCPHGGDGVPGRPRGAFLERHPSFECLELGLNELMLPQLQRPHPSALSPSPSPWLDSPYLSSSPSPSQASSLSPYPADSPVSSSPCAPAAFAQLSPGCPAPPFEPLPCPFAPESCPPSPSPSLYPLPLSVSQHYFHADAPTPLPAPPPPSYPGRFGGGSCDWDLRQRGFQCGDPPSHPPQPGSGAPPSGVKPEEMPLDFGAPPPITLEEVNEFIGDNLTEFPHAGLEGRPA
uniref:Basic proline-rich protein-like n=1 Tax=Lepisosteus oculatus TaxID=7918 RepID=W5LWE6_LEPOC|nr:PREDICTED: basic proline-rich protein-like [Lepisosteus oculatus]